MTSLNPVRIKHVGSVARKSESQHCRLVVKIEFIGNTSSKQPFFKFKKLPRKNLISRMPTSTGQSMRLM